MRIFLSSVYDRKGMGRVERKAKRKERGYGFSFAPNPSSLSFFPKKKRVNRPRVTIDILTKFYFTL